MERRKALKKTGTITGGALLFPSMIALLQSCKEQSRIDWKPLFLDVNEAQFISSLVDTILPTTDTPGALDVKVDVFLDKVFAETYDDKAKKELRSEIATFNNNCKQNFGGSFVNLSQADKDAVLKKEEASGAKFNGTVWGGAVGKQEPIGFYRSMKSMAIWAYMTSEEIGKNVLSYDPIPGSYKACIDVSTVGNKWSLG